GHECAGLQIAAALELEHIAFGADHRPLVEAFHEGPARRNRSVHRGAFWNGWTSGNIARLLRWSQFAADMSPPGRPKGEYRSAEREATPPSPPGRPQGRIPKRQARRYSSEPAGPPPRANTEARR